MYFPLGHFQKLENGIGVDADVESGDKSETHESGADDDDGDEPKPESTEAPSDPPEKTAEAVTASN